MILLIKILNYIIVLMSQGDINVAAYFTVLKIVMQKKPINIAKTTNFIFS